jgi:RNA polymerase sigma-70 factor (ECF subfamily)
MPLDPTLRDQMLSAVPSLRAFAISLSGNVDRADDLVQETLLRAIANIDSFQPGTNM